MLHLTCNLSYSHVLRNEAFGDSLNKYKSETMFVNPNFKIKDTHKCVSYIFLYVLYKAWAADLYLIYQASRRKSGTDRMQMRYNITCSANASK